MSSERETTVAVITRTKDRPVLLKRAIASVASQTFQDWAHVIVNDGGDANAVEAAVTGVGHRDRVITLHHATSKGMEAASNAGIRSSKSTYIVVLDDDDSWEPTFLSRCVDYLERPPFRLAADVGGVVTHSVKVEEVIVGDGVVIRSRKPYNDWIRGISLGLLAARNMFPTNSFVFRRSVLEDVGYFREDLPVLGDWDFNLRVAEKYEIAVIPELLASFHHRVSGNANSYGNSVVAGNERHLIYDVLLRNEYLRRDLREGKTGLGVVMEIARNNQDLVRMLRSKRSPAARWTAAVARRWMRSLSRR